MADELANRKVHVLSLCCGVETPSVALSQLGAKVACFSYDADPNLESAVWYVHENYCEGGKFFIGDSGDICTVDKSTIPDVEIIVAGPPCPPWSQCGSGQGGGSRFPLPSFSASPLPLSTIHSRSPPSPCTLPSLSLSRSCSLVLLFSCPRNPLASPGGSWSDERSKPFRGTIEHVKHQAARPSKKLKCVLLENVKGIENGSKAGTSPMDGILRQLNAEVPGFVFWHWEVDSAWHGLPHSRPRTSVSK